MGHCIPLNGCFFRNTTTRVQYKLPHHPVGVFRHFYRFEIEEKYVLDILPCNHQCSHETMECCFDLITNLCSHFHSACSPLVLFSNSIVGISVSCQILFCLSTWLTQSLDSSENITASQSLNIHIS